MTEIVLLGLNHNSAPVTIRERLAFSKEEVENALGALRAKTDIDEILLYSTCNRVEFLFTSDAPERAVKSIKAYLKSVKQIALTDFEPVLYQYNGDEAVRHIFRVGASLDSMIVGEPQILGQLKEAFKVAVAHHTTSVILNRLFHRTFFVAKRIRSETGIADNAVSISYAAIELGKKIFGSLDQKKVLLIGAGEMAELAVEHLIRNKASKIFVANRTFAHGVALAQKWPQGSAILFEEIQEYLNEVDIIISSTGARTFILHHDQVKKILKKRKHRPLFFIDIAVPRNIDPQVNRLTDAYVYDIDDLKGIVDENIEERKKEALKGERIVDEGVIRFRAWLDNLAIVPTIKALRHKFAVIATAEITKTGNALSHLTADDEAALIRMGEAIVNKMLHDPMLHLKNASHDKTKSVYVSFVRDLFQLDD